MGFLWFGNAVNKWKDIGDEKDLKEQRAKLNGEWTLLLSRKETAQSQYKRYTQEAAKDSIDGSAKERAAYEMGRITKSIRQYDDELNLTLKGLGTLDAVLDLKKAEARSDALRVSLGNLSTDELEETLISAAQAREEQKLNDDEINIIVTSHRSPIRTKVEQDDDMRTALADIEAAKNSMS
jgi:hypothetical protein